MTVTKVVIFDMFNTLAQDHPQQWDVTLSAIIKDQQLDTDLEVFKDEWHSQGTVFQRDRVKPDLPFISYFEGWRDAFDRTFAVLGLRGDADAASRKSIHDLGIRPLFDEAFEALKAIQRKWRTAVLSNADDDFLLPALAGAGLQFETVLSSEQARCYKPNAGLFQEMLRRLNIDPAEGVYVGDRQYEDIQGAGQVGLRTMWVNRSGGALDPNLSTPDMEISSLLEIPQRLG
jgi:2-haloalkanoic acid dehalogenase type II